MPHPRNAIRTCCMYVADQLASTPRIAIAVPTVPHSSVLACMTTSWACQVSATVAPMSGPSATFDPAPTPLSSCHCCWPGSSARDCSKSCTMRRTASSEPSRCPPTTPACPTSVAGCGNRDTLPCAPHGNISQWSCPQRLQLAGGGDHSGRRSTPCYWSSRSGHPPVIF